MAAKGYTTTDLVAAELGRTLTAPQLAQCATLIEQAEAWIDHVTGGTWLLASTVTDELHYLTGQVVYLHRWPVAAIASLTVRQDGAQETDLVVGDDYDILDGAHGMVMVRGFGRGTLLKVSYTTDSVVLPGDLARAATMLVAHWMLRSLDPDRQGLESYSVGSDLSVKFRTDSNGGVPDDLLAMVRSHRVSIVMA